VSGNHLVRRRFSLAVAAAAVIGGIIYIVWSPGNQTPRGTTQLSPAAPAEFRLTVGGQDLRFATNLESDVASDQVFDAGAMFEATGQFSTTPAMANQSAGAKPASSIVGQTLLIIGPSDPARPATDIAVFPLQSTLARDHKTVTVSSEGSFPVEPGDYLLQVCHFRSLSKFAHQSTTCFQSYIRIVESKL
jgi:hypothetical protein